MTLAELVQEVYNITNRPDLVNETSSAIRESTLKGHQSDYYFKDILEVGVNFGAAAYVQNLDYRALILNWRSLKYLRKFDNVNQLPKYPDLDIVLPENVFNDYQQVRCNIVYGAGAFLQINSGTLEQYYLLGCYVNPIITTAGYSSWIALDHPWYIINGAAAKIFKSIGKDDEAATYRAEMADQLAMLKTANILVNGF